jgi:GH15 family glucan-1,4-alpha-glucosidase
MCWAGADRMSRIAKVHRPQLADEFAATAARIREEILSKAIDPKRGCLVADYGGVEVDAALLQAITLRFLPPDDPRAAATVDAIREDLGLGEWLRRYRTNDGLGIPCVAFTLCTLWLVDVLARLGREDEARTILEQVRRIHSPLGLLSEDFRIEDGTMWGNFPQAYSHVGMIHAAFSAAPRWSEYGS